MTKFNVAKCGIDFSAIATKKPMSLIGVRIANNVPQAICRPEWHPENR